MKAVIGKTLNDERRIVSNGEILHKVDKNTGNDAIFNNFLLCKDEKDEEVIINLSHRGKFYKASKDPECENSVFQMCDLLKGNLDTPIYIRHVVGEIPMLTSAYSSLLELVSVAEETTILASTLDEKTMMPLELQTNSRIKFKISLNESRLRHSEPFSEAMEFCQSDGEGYMKGMKIAFQMSPENWIESNTSIASSNGTLDLENITSSLGGVGAVGMEEESCYSDSDIGEEDAQSEFTFKWTNENEENGIDEGNLATGGNNNGNSKNDVVEDRNRNNPKSDNGFVKEESIPVTESDKVKNVNNLNIQNVVVKDISDLNSEKGGVKDGNHPITVNDDVKDGHDLNSQYGVAKDVNNLHSQNSAVKDGHNRNRQNANVACASSPKSPRSIFTEEKGVPKVFNSCIKSSRESVVWNEEPDIV